MRQISGRLRAGLLAPAVLGMALALAGCGQASAPAPTPTPWLTSGTPTAAASPTSSGAPGGAISFKADIEPIFQAHCAACHIAIQSGGLYLGDYQGLIKGGNVVPGPIVKPGNHADSILYQIISPSGSWPGGNRMPLGGPYLDGATINTIATWIDQGAKDN
jgi:mono/diheme cytochrome c family protein